MGLCTDKCGHVEFRNKPHDHGPWDDEPDRVDFEHAGLNCLLHRNQFGAWCGYVGVAPGHRDHGISYDDVDDYGEVHGGLTYSDLCQGPICHIPKPGEPEHLWWFGFDCAHSGDMAHGMSAISGLHFEGDSYRDMAYAMGHTKRLAEQLASKLV